MSTYKKIDQYQEVHVTTIEEIYNTIVEYNIFRNLPRHAFTEDGPLLQGFYRGQNNSEWDISPSLLRTKIPEPQILRNFSPNKKMSFFGTIAYIQHHQTGTRFIDFTTNPDVAIFFACLGSDNTDGAVFLYDYAPHQAEWYTSVVLSELARLEDNDKITVQYLAEQVLKNNPDLSNRFNSIEELNGGIISFLDHGFMVLPDNESLNENLRLKRQQGCFFICGVEFEPELIPTRRWFSHAGKNYFYPHSAVIPSSLKNGHTLVKLIIAKECKQDILKYLESKGITHDYLFPE